MTDDNLELWKAYLKWEMKYEELQQKLNERKMMTTVNELQAQNAIKNVDVKAYKNAMKIEEPISYKKLYAVKDIDMGLMDIYPSANDVIAIRNFGSAVKENKGLSMYPEKFELYKLGEVNSYSGEFVPDLRKLATATDFAELNK